MDLWSLRNHDPRPEQRHIINEIRSALESDYTNIILEAGTGIGKSPIATTVARYADSSYILTMTNQLQNQYLTDFRYMLTEIKGRNNYPCNYNGSCADCNISEHNKLQMQKYEIELKEWNRKMKLKQTTLSKQPNKPELDSYCEDCEYILAFQSASNSPNIITNYDYLFYAGNYAKQWDTRDLLVLDEAHNFEKKIMSLVSEDINRKIIFDRNGFDIFEHVAKRGALKDIAEIDYWINIIEKCIDLETNATKYDVDSKAQMYVQKYQRILSKLKHNGFIIDLPMRKEIIADKDMSARLKVEFKPISGKEYVESILKFGNHRLFMTGTLGNKQLFCNWNGLDPEDTYYIYQKSPFPVENRPIIRKYVCSMKQDGWRNHHIIKYIKKIIDSHNGEKGVIHTSSNQQAWFVKKQLNSRSVWVAQGNTREDTIKRFEESDYPLILVGAGLKDGVDFKGDKCRYQILFKVPYPSIGSQQVKIRKKLDPVWYIYQTVMPLMQSYGRGIRDMDDYCKFYILDEDFEFIIKEYKSLFNEYFLEAIQ